MSQFESFVNAELPKRVATNADPLVIPPGQVFVSTGVGLLTELRPYVSGSGEGNPPIIHIIPSQEERIFSLINLSTRKSFEWTVEVVNEENVKVSKVMAVFNSGVLDDCEFAILGHIFSTEVIVEKVDTFCQFKIRNNESFPVTASVKLW